MIAFLVFFAVDVFDMDEWHDFEPELILDSKKSLMVYDKNGGEASLLYSKENRQWIGIDEIPMHVRYAFISAEDARFYEHGGVDIIRIFGAGAARFKGWQPGTGGVNDKPAAYKTKPSDHRRGKAGKNNGKKA